MVWVTVLCIDRWGSVSLLVAPLGALGFVLRGKLQKWLFASCCDQALGVLFVWQALYLSTVSFRTCQEGFYIFSSFIRASRSTPPIPSFVTLDRL